MLKTLWYVDEEDAVETGEISLFVGHKFVITVRHGAGGGLNEARQRLEAASSVLAHGPSAVVYAVCDAVVDRYEEVAGVAPGGRRRGRGVGVLDPAHQRLRPHLHPQARAGRDAPRGDAAAGADEPVHRRVGRTASTATPAPYFRDVADHLNRVAETIDSLDCLLSTAFEAHIAQISIQQNDDMRRISAAVGLIAAPDRWSAASTA